MLQFPSKNLKFSEKYKAETQSFGGATQQFFGHGTVQNAAFYNAAVQTDITATKKITNTIMDDIVHHDTCKPFVMYKLSLNAMFVTAFDSHLQNLTA